MSIVADIEHTRLFPDSLGSGAKRAFTRIFGAILTMAAIAGWLCLATWSNQDPSLSNATDLAATNLLGYGGAVVADLLFQTLGLAAILAFLPMAAWGWHLLTLIKPNRVAERLLLWPLSLAMLAGALAALSIAKGWPLSVGHGGFIGDHVLRAVMIAGSFIELNSGITKLMAGVLLPILSFWGLSAACGIKVSNYGILLKRSTANSKPVFDEEVIDYISEPSSTPENIYETVQARIPVVGHVDHMGRIEPVVAHPTSSVDPASVLVPAQHVATDQPVENIVQQQQAQIAASMAPAGDNVVSMNGEANADASGQTSAPAPVFAYDPEADKKQSRHKVIRAEQLPLLDMHQEGFALPPLEFLTQTPTGDKSEVVSDKILLERADLLEQVLEDFKVKGEVIDVKPGPIVTMYEFEPARGVKSSQVIGLADDIARTMGAISARVAVIPGRNAIGIELPNEKREIVYLREQLETIYNTEKKAKLPLVLGKDISGTPNIVDLAKMPHLLIAGTTGSGKSVGINAMILSLLYNLTPEQCKFIMIDPKMLELSVYDGIPHLLSPVVTDPKKAVVALNWVVREMEDRYKKMSQITVRNIGGYNSRIREAKDNGVEITQTVQTGFDKGTGQAIYEKRQLDYQELPYIVVVIDEMADLMMVAGKDIEGSIQRLAQKARAAGIHLITATQRPSVDVITGTIKANFPTRISFQVTSKIDSRTILGEMGAEQLLGSGDMLHMAGGGQITRVHGSFVSDQEVERVANYLKAQGVPQYLEAVTKGEREEAEASNTKETAQEKFESLYDEAVAIVVRDQKASTSYIQRRLSIGYNKAATLIERMEDEGVIGRANNAGKREILVPAEPSEATM
jgi:DNA segregation ATPase FtsK/SpoIIIE, S-DNA-T family